MGEMTIWKSTAAWLGQGEGTFGESGMVGAGSPESMMNDDFFCSGGNS